MSEVLQPREETCIERCSSIDEVNRYLDIIFPEEHFPFVKEEALAQAGLLSRSIAGYSVEISVDKADGHYIVEIKPESADESYI